VRPIEPLRLTMGSRWWQLLRVMLTSQREVGAQRLLRGHDAQCGVQSGAWKYNVQVSVFGGVFGERETDTVNRAGSTTCEKPFPREFVFLTSSRMPCSLSYKTFTVHEHVNKSKTESRTRCQEINFVSIIIFLWLLVVAMTNASRPFVSRTASAGAITRDMAAQER
jgi:hypothetical protein